MISLFANQNNPNPSLSLSIPIDDSHLFGNPSTSTSTIPLDPFLTSLDQSNSNSISNSNSNSISISISNSNYSNPFQNNSSIQTFNLTPTSIPRLPKSKLIQSNQLNLAAQRTLNAIWDTLTTANISNPPQLEISRNLDCLLGELHASAVPFKQDALALIWPQSLSNKSLKASFNTRRSPAYFSIRRANIAFVAEYILYAMPGEEAYGKNDIVFACEGFLPLALDPELVLEPESWKLFHELKIQIYIQRLDQSGADEANSRVLPNLFVESLSSYSGLQVPLEAEVQFEKLATETKEEIVTARADLDLLRTKHPYNKFVTWALEFLHQCANRVDQEEQDCNQLESSELPVLNFPLVQDINRSGKKKQRHRPENNIPSSPPLHPYLRPGPSNQEIGGIHLDFSNPVDINVEQNEEEEYGLEGEAGSRGRYNPYRLGRGKGPTSAPRRRWTQQEYDLLLEEVRLHSNKYDCMAQIIKRHGKNGELSEILKDQNNVSLKDKARNLTMEWQRNGYPEDKPWLKLAFARFSVKNFKRSSNNQSMTVANKEGGHNNAMHQDNFDDGRDSGGNLSNDGNIELESDGNIYLNQNPFSEGSNSGVLGVNNFQVDGNIPVISNYENQTDIEDEELVDGEESSKTSCTLVQHGQTDTPREDETPSKQVIHDIENDQRENERITKEIEESNRTNFVESYSHSDPVDLTLNLAIDFEIHPNLLISSTDPLPAQIFKQKIHPPCTTSTAIASNDTDSLSQQQLIHPSLIENQITGSNGNFIDQLLDPNLLS